MPSCERAFPTDAALERPAKLFQMRLCTTQLNMPKMEHDPSAVVGVKALADPAVLWLAILEPFKSADVFLLTASEPPAPFSLQLATDAGQPLRMWALV
jgi:hypothetical protein